MAKSTGYENKTQENSVNFFPAVSLLSSYLEFDSQLAEDNMTVKDGFSLLLNLKLPTLLGILYLIQHIGSTAGTGQHIMGICKRLVILKVQEWRTSEITYDQCKTHSQNSGYSVTEIEAVGLFKEQTIYLTMHS